MGLGFYTGLRNRNTRIRERNEFIEDRDAANQEWQARFDKQNEAAWGLWKRQNDITSKQASDAASAAAIASTEKSEREMAHERDMLSLENVYTSMRSDEEYEKWLKKQKVTFDYGEQSAVNAQGRLEAWDDKKHKRDVEANIEQIVTRIGLETEAAKDRVKFELKLKSGYAEEEAIADHAREMKKILIERVMDSKLIGTDFVAAVDGTTDTKSKISQYAAAIEALGVQEDNPVLAQLAGLNNPTVMKSAFDILQKHHQELVKSGQTGQNLIDSFREGANEYFGNLVITEPDPSKADALIKQMETVLGGPLDALVKSSIKSNVGTTGSIVAPIEPTIVESLDPGKLGEWTNVIKENVKARANTERNSISKAKTTLNEIQKTGTPDEVQTAKEVLAFITERDTKIAMSLDDAKKDDLFGLIMMYGNAGVEEIKAAEPRFETAPIPEMLKQAMEAAPIEVSNTKILRALINYGIIKKGDKVTYINADGKKVTKTYSGK